MEYSEIEKVDGSLLAAEDSPEGRVAQMILWVVPHPEDVKIAVTRGHAKVLIEIDVRPEDRGCVIGTNGEVIKSIRRLLVSSLRNNERGVWYDVSLLNDARRQGGGRSRDFRK